MRRTGFLLALGVLAVLLAACGNKGELVKPGAAPPPPTSTSGSDVKPGTQPR